MIQLSEKPVKKVRRDGQMSGLAGEFFVAAHLLKRDIQAAPTWGNAKNIDLFAQNPRTGRVFSIQVKTLRESNCFLLDHRKVDSRAIYVFVLLNKERFFIVPGTVLANQPDRFGKSFVAEVMPGITPGSLTSFENKWDVFEA